MGNLFVAFSINLGTRNTFWAKLWGMYLGLKLAKELNLQHVEFELDSKIVVHLIKTGRTANAHLQPLL